MLHILTLILLFCPEAQGFQAPVCYHSSAPNTWKHLLFKNNWEPQGQRVIQTLRFLGWFCAPPAISRKTSGLNGLGHSREKQKACQSPAERQFNLVTYRTAKGSRCLQVCIPDYYQSNYCHRKICSRTSLSLPIGLFFFWDRMPFKSNSDTKHRSSHLRMVWITGQRIVNQVILVFAKLMPSHAADLKDGQQ